MYFIFNEDVYKTKRICSNLISHPVKGWGGSRPLLPSTPAWLRGCLLVSCIFYEKLQVSLAANCCAGVGENTALSHAQASP